MPLTLAEVLANPRPSVQEQIDAEIERHRNMTPFQRIVSSPAIRGLGDLYMPQWRRNLIDEAVRAAQREAAIACGGVEE